MDKKAKSILVFSLIALVIVSSIILLVSAVDSVVNSSPTNVLEDASYLYNFTVTNANYTINITQVNITVPAGFTIDVNTNSTSASLDNVSGNTTFISWTNTTEKLILYNSTQYFWFNATAANPGSYNFTLTVMDQLGSVDNYIAIVVNDSTIIFLNTPLAGVNSSSNSVVFNCTATTTDTLYNITLYVWNSTNSPINETTTSVGGNSNESAVNVTLPSDDVYRWNCRACDAGASSFCVFNLPNRTLTVDSANPQIISAGVSNPDIFFSSYDSIVNISANISDLTSLTVQANFSNISTSACGTDGILNLTYIGGLWKGNCSIASYITNTIPQPRAITIVAVDSANHINATVPPLSAISPIQILVHNMDVPSMQGGNPCNKFGNLTTNFTKVLNFSSVNFIIQMEMNGSCLAGPGNGSSPWPGFQQVMMMNFSSLNMSDPTIGQRLQGLKDALQVNITPPHEFGLTRIYVNETAFAELNTNVTITLNNLPFASNPTIIPDNASKSTANVVWTNNTPFNITVTYPVPINILVPNGNLQFTVEGFSGYNETDNLKPLITINSPAALVTTSTFTVNVTVNGTITQPTQIIISGLGTTYTYNSTYNSANCTEISPASDTYNCLFSATLPDAQYTLNVTAYDYGGTDPNGPGNTNSTSMSVIVDASIPSLYLMSPANGTLTNTKNVSFTFNVTDTFADTAGGYPDCNLFLDHPADGVNFNISSINMSATVVNISVIHNIADGLHNWTVECYDGHGNENISETRFFTVDATLPVPALGSPLAYSNQTSQTVLINLTITETNLNYSTIAIYSGITLINSSTNTTAKSINTSLSVPADGAYSVFASVYDLAGNSNSTSRNLTVDSSAPSISGSPSSSPANGSVYNLTKPYQFNVTVTDSGVGVYKVIMTFNGSNYTMGSAGVNAYTNSSIVGLAAGTYAYSFWYNDTLGNAQASATYLYTVSQAAGVILADINGTRSNIAISNSTAVMLNATLTTGVLGTISLYKNSTLIFNGTSPTGNFTNFTITGMHNITAVYSGNQNYSASSDTLWVNVLGASGTFVNDTSITVNENQTQVVVTNSSLFQNVTVPITVPSNQSVSVDLSVLLSNGNVTLGNSTVTLARINGTVNYTAVIPANTNISGGAGWDGIITMPMVNTSTFTAPTGSANVVIDMGSSVELNFSSAVKVVIGGMAGKKAAWSRGSATLTQITTQCDNATAPTNINATTPRECYIDSGSDLLVWTYHFTSFAAYTPSTTTPPTTPSLEGGGSVTAGEVPISGGTLTAEGIEKELKAGNTLSFSIDSAQHSLNVISINSNYATVKLQSSPIVATINKGETKNFDLDVNGEFDTSVYLKDVVISGNFYAGIFVLRTLAAAPQIIINETLCGNGILDTNENCGNCAADVKCASGEKCQANACVKTTVTEEVIQTVKETSYWLIIALAAVIAITIVITLIKKRKQQEKPIHIVKHYYHHHKK